MCIHYSTVCDVTCSFLTFHTFSILERVAFTSSTLSDCLDVVFVDSNYGVVGLSVPKQDDLTGTDVAVASKVVGQGSCFEILHEDVGQ